MKEEIQKKHDEFNILWKRIQQVENAKEIPQIEIDLGLEKIRELYDYFIQLNNINKKTMDVSEIIAESSEKENKSKLKQIFSKSKKKEEKQAQEDIIIEEEQVAIINETPIVIEEKVAPEIIFEPVAEIIAPVKEENENKIIVEKTEIVKQEKTAEEVKKEAARLGVEVNGSEIVGLVPLESMLQAGRFYSNGKEKDEKNLVNIAIEKLGLSALHPFKPEEKIIEYMI